MKKLTVIALVFVVISASAQTQFSLYRLNANLPQANMINPAFAPNSRVVIGLPVLSSVRLSADNAGISFRDIFKSTERDSLRLDTASIFSKMKAANAIRMNGEIQLFYLGIRGKKGYFSLAAHQVTEFRMNYPGDLVGWAIRGPGSSYYRNRPLDFNNFYGKSVTYGKLSLNYARDITPRLRVGFRYNYLIGIAAAETTNLKGRLTLSSDSVNLSTEPIRVETGGIDFFDQDNLSNADFQNYLLKGRNKGMSIDLGATYQVNNKLTVSASVIDLGYINWKDYTRTYEVAPVNYTFRGFDVLDYVNQQNGDEFLQGELDSLESLFTGSERTGNAFRTSLIGKFYAGINYKVLKVNNFSALLYMDMYQRRITPALSIGYNLQINRFMNSTIGLTLQDGKINNVGAGIALKLTSFQIFATSDRANSIWYPARAGRADAQVGINMVFGKIKKKEPLQKIIKEKKSTPNGEEKTDDAPPQYSQPDNNDAPDTKTETNAIYVDPISTDSDSVITTYTTISGDSSGIELPAESEVHVTKGGHEKEMMEGAYVIVGSFQSEENAIRYSESLRAEGYENSYGYATSRGAYLVYVFKSSDLEQTRKVRDQYRMMSNPQFKTCWILAVDQ